MTFSSCSWRADGSSAVAPERQRVATKKVASFMLIVFRRVLYFMTHGEDDKRYLLLFDNRLRQDAEGSNKISKVAPRLKSLSGDG